MATKKPTKPPGGKRLVKVHLDPDDYDRVRLAAALKRMGIGDFARSVLAEEARRLTANIEMAD